MDGLIDKLVKDARPVTPAANPFAQSLKWVVGFAIYVVVLMLFFPPRPDLLHKLQSPLFLAEILALVLMVITTALSSALLAFPDLWQKAKLAYAPLGAFILFLVVIFMAWRADNPPAPAPAHEMACTVCITLFALVPALWLFATMRKSASTHSGIAGYSVMLSAFSLGALTLRLSEQTDSIMHVVQWHYAPMLLLSIIGVFAGKILLKW